MDNNSSQPPIELLNTPQRLGIIPTFGFWRTKRARGYARPFMIIGLAATFFLIISLELSEWAAAVYGLCLPALSLGLAERSLRAQMLRARNKCAPD